MPARWIAIGALLAVASAAPSAGATTPRLLVAPEAPLVGLRATIRVTLPIKVAAPLTVTVVSPTGIQRRLPLRRVGPYRWRTTFHFADDGRWTLAIARGRVTLVNRVTVLQPPAALPGLATNSSGGLGGVFGGR